MIKAGSSRQELLDGVRATFDELFEIDPAEVHPESTLFDELDLDSLDAADMRARLQEITGRNISEVAFQEMRTVQDVVELLERTLAE